MAKDLQTLRSEWQACLVAARVAFERLKKAEQAWRSAYLLSRPDPAGLPLVPATERGPFTKPAQMPKHANPYPGA